MYPFIEKISSEEEPWTYTKDQTPSAWYNCYEKI